MSEPKASSEEELSKGPGVPFYPRYRTVCGSATFQSREVGKVSIPMIWHVASWKKMISSVFDPI